ncbi:hypothetical protein [Crossiella cryophila]|uniref:hypothetical protein n=1 Tax=Crossiella cryophila TaxID=43355 RepID=UPI003CD0A477
MARTTVHRRFATREALVAAMIDAIMAQVEHAINAACTETAPPLVALHQLAANLVTVKSVRRCTPKRQALTDSETLSSEDRARGKSQALSERITAAGLLAAEVCRAWPNVLSPRFPTAQAVAVEPWARRPESPCPPPGSPATNTLAPARRDPSRCEVSLFPLGSEPCRQPKLRHRRLLAASATVSSRQCNPTAVVKSGSCGVPVRTARTSSAYRRATPCAGPADTVATPLR